MVDNKLIWSELRKALAVRAGVKESEANAFLNALQSELIEALKKDKSVKINGLGTFKLQTIAPRKSVNVKTGEEIVIEEYNKIAFAPEAGVKELVEKGVSELGSTAEALGLLHDEQEEEFNPLKKLGEQAEEIVEILGELGQRPGEGVQSTEYRIQTELEEEEKEEPEVVEEPEKEPEVVEEKKEEPKEEKPKERKYHFVRDTMICVVVLLLLLLVGYFFLRSQLSGWIEELVNSEGVQNTEYRVQTEEGVQTEGVQNTEYRIQTELEKQEEIKETPKEEKWSYDEILLTEEITEGSRLAWIAKKHYGNKIYWVYLYDANKDRVKNPGRIAVGTPIRVPKLSAAQRDTTDVRFLKIKEEAERAIKK